MRTPATQRVTEPTEAAVFELKVHLAEGRGLEGLLLDAGIDASDAAAAASLATGQVGDNDGCFGTVSISKGADGRQLRIVRVSLTTDRERTVIERHGGELTVASRTAVRQFPRLV